MKKIKQDLTPVDKKKIPAILEQFLKEFNFDIFASEAKGYEIKLTKRWTDLEQLVGREFKSRSKVVLTLRNHETKYRSILKKYPLLFPLSSHKFAPDREKETLKLNSTTYKVLYGEFEI